MFNSVNGFIAIMIKAEVTSGKQFHVSHANFLPFTRCDITASETMKKWQCQGPFFSKILILCHLCANKRNSFQYQMQPKCLLLNLV